MARGGTIALFFTLYWTPSPRTPMPRIQLGFDQLSSPGSGICWDSQAESEIMEHKEGTIAGQGRALESNLGGKPQQHGEVYNPKGEL